MLTSALATYEYVEQGDDDNSAWVGPLIYDQDGELVWSGAPMFHGYNVKDFKVSNVAGTPMLTGVYAKEGVEVVLNSNYEIVQRVPIDLPQHINIHGFNTVDNGTRSLAMTQRSAFASKEESKAIGFDGECHVSFPGFEERDTSTWKQTFAWNSQDHIRLNESHVPHTCKRVWDYLHANSVDRFPDGDYLYSGRHSDTVYKISGQNGSIIWRFRGQDSDFAFDDHFSGQHDARVREQNETHTIISILDNAIRPGTPHITNDQSRGMIIALRIDTQPMTATVLKKYNHPDASYAPGRGNFQLLDNGNAFLAWWMRSLISENAPEGKLLMEASWIPELKSYRSYKFPWVGKPTEPPDVHSRAVNWTEEAGVVAEAVQTVVYVSWNGATEVASWKLYKTTAEGGSREQIANVKRQGFETMLTYDGFASYVVVEGVDHDGHSLGESDVVKSIPPRSSFGSAVVEEQQWIQDQDQSPSTKLAEKISPTGNPIAAYIWGVLTCVGFMLGLRLFRMCGRKSGQRPWVPQTKSGEALFSESLSDEEEYSLDERHVTRREDDFDRR